MEITTLVLRSMQGDREAFIEIVKQLESSLYRTAKSILKKDEDVADVLQETILKAYQAIHTLREPDFFKTWMFRILINECNSLLTNHSRMVSYAEVPSSQSSSDDYNGIDLRQAVDRLNEEQRIAIILFYYEDMSLRQVAETLEISQSAVKMRLTRARKALMDMLQTYEKGEVNYGSL